MAHPPPPPTEPLAAPAKGDEQPGVITALEFAAYNGLEGDDGETSDPLALPAPARLLSGWTAARLMGEACAASAPMGGASSTKAFFAPPNAGGLGVTFGWPQGGGLSTLGMGPLRFDLSLSQRLAALNARREEQDARYGAARRRYVQALRDFSLEQRERTTAITALREDVATARAAVRPGRATHLFTTDEEEWASVDIMTASAQAVVRQNAELRSRLASATGRASSGNVDGEGGMDANSECALILRRGNGEVVAGGARAVKRKRVAPGCSRGGPISDEEDAGELKEEASVDPASEGAAPGSNAYLRRQRSTARYSENRGVVLALGDLVVTPYGRGVVLGQRDPLPSCSSFTQPLMVRVLLQWGAVASINTSPLDAANLQSSTLVLLAVAGEEYTGPREHDAHLLANAASLSSRALASAPLAHGASALTAPLSNADDALFGSKPLRSTVHVPSLSRRGFVSASEPLRILPMDDAIDSATSERVMRGIKPNCGVALSSRFPIFRTSADRTAPPRGVPLCIDTMRGTASLGYIIGPTFGPQPIRAVGAGAAVAPTAPIPASPSADALHVDSSAPVVTAALAKAAGPSNTSSDPFPPPSPLNTGALSSRLPSEVAYRAESARLRTQLRVRDELVADLRRRLSDSRACSSQLLESINAFRISEAESAEELACSSAENVALAARIVELRQRYEASAIAAEAAVGGGAIKATQAAARKAAAGSKGGGGAFAAPRSPGAQGGFVRGVSPRGGALASGRKAPAAGVQSSSSRYRGLLHSAAGGEEEEDSGSGDVGMEEEEEGEGSIKEEEDEDISDAAEAGEALGSVDDSGASEEDSEAEAAIRLLRAPVSHKRGAAAAAAAASLHTVRRRAVPPASIAEVGKRVVKRPRASEDPLPANQSTFAALLAVDGDEDSAVVGEEEEEDIEQDEEVEEEEEEEEEQEGGGEVDDAALVAAVAAGGAAVSLRGRAISRVPSASLDVAASSRVVARSAAGRRTGVGAAAPSQDDGSTGADDDESLSSRLAPLAGRSFRVIFHVRVDEGAANGAYSSALGESLRTLPALVGPLIARL